MNRWSESFKCFVALFCEGVWLYYGLKLFFLIHWDMDARFQPIDWWMAGTAGYFLFRWFGGKGVSPNVSFLVYALFWGLIVYLNLKDAPKEVWDVWGGVVGLTVAVSFLYVRGMYFALRGVTRRNMLLRLEGNMMFYLLFALVNEVRTFAGISLHLMFGWALALSLVGMLFTLRQGREEDGVTTRQAGHGAWGLFPFLLCLLLGGVFSVLFLWSYVRDGLKSFLTAAGEGIWAAARGVYSVLVWLMGLLPDVQTEPTPPPAEPGLKLPSEEQMMDMTTLNLGPYVFVLALFAVLALLVVLSRKWAPAPSISPSPHRRTGMNLRGVLGRMISRLLRFFRRLIGGFRRNFPGYYPFRVYYDYYRLLRWGKKNGIPRRKQETPREYASRLAMSIPREHHSIGEKIRELSDAFASVYYSGGKMECRESFHPLFRQLKEVSLRTAHETNRRHSKSGVSDSNADFS